MVAAVSVVASTAAAAGAATEVAVGVAEIRD